MTTTPPPPSNGGNTAADLELGLNHCWDWFALHASQRVQMVNFFVLAMAFITAAFVACVVGQRGEVAAGVALLGLIVPTAFWRLEVRTRELVRIGRTAVIEYERKLAELVEVDSLRMAEKAEESVRHTNSYGTLITRFYSGVGAIYFAGFVYAVVLASR